MNINEQDFNNINEIDLECNVADDDDFIVKDVDINTSIGDDREIKSKTGIIINLSDDDVIEKDESVKDFEIQNFNDENNVNFDIDLETDYPDDTEDIFNEKELVDETLIPILKSHKKHNNTNTPKINHDYWNNIAKKHKSSNKKGSYNTNFHFAGNPEEDAEFFNHIMGTDTGSTNNTSSNSVDAIDVSNISSDASLGFCESIDIIQDDTKSEKIFSDKFDKFLYVLGFEALKNSDNSFTVLDLANPDNDFECQNISDMIKSLEPYIYDCIIIPLQIKTNQSLSNCKEWDNWYKNLDQASVDKYIDCQDELQFCDLITNHLDECVIY